MVRELCPLIIRKMLVLLVSECNFQKSFSNTVDVSFLERLYMSTLRMPLTF
jgi:hypothetical protein